MRASNWYDYRRQILQLSRDRGNYLVSGSSFKDFQELGPHTGEHWPFTKEAVRRAWGDPKDRDDPSSEYVENLRAASQVVFERLMVGNLYVDAPRLYQKWASVFTEDESGHRDYEHLAEKAEEDWEAKDKLRRVDLALNLLTDYAMSAGPNGEPVELFVEFARARTLREEKTMERRNAQIDAECQDLIEQGHLEKDAVNTICDRWGLSPERVRDIRRLKREERGEPRRLPGRPRKKSA